MDESPAVVRGPGGAEAVGARESGTICAVAGQAQREMREWAAAYPRLFGAEAFDPALYSTLALAAAFSGPWYTAGQLRMANKACLWCFALDWLVDYAATSREEVADLARRCLAVADGGAPAEGDDLARFLADIRDELSSAPSFPALREVWRDELSRMLEAMALEWEWKTGDRPAFEEYLGNADNLGFSFVFASHWIFTTTAPPDDLEGVRAASREAQRVIRLLNDLGTYERDVKWGDLNALMLGVGRDEVDRRITELAAGFRELTGRLRGDDLRLARYMERQMDFCVGFYGVTDFWGAA
ncbi:terpene synthase family protein [Actinomadura scrupuli]|uniref:terpene synthase family protein n=1 Tax=Actinomadura scrupuli TaxID=559629 RepID=UPI003D95641E